MAATTGSAAYRPSSCRRISRQIIELAQTRKLRVILAGMEAPPNFGDDYTKRFRAVYPALAARYKIPLIPFLLDGVAGDPSLNQADGIHPNPRGAQIVADLGLAHAGATAHADGYRTMIELRGVSKTVSSGGEPLTILHPLTMTVPAGQCLAIIGPSGSGKSTLLGLIAGLDSPSSGQILIDGTDITALDEDGSRGCAAKRSASSSSSSTWCRR